MPKITFQLDPDEEAIFHSQKKSTYKGAPFISIGKAGITKHKIKGFPMATVLKDLSLSATWLYWSLIERRNPRTNEAILLAASLNQTDKNKVSRGYKELLAKNMVKRIKKEHYFLNPATAIPDPKNLAEAVTAEWNKLP